MYNFLDVWEGMYHNQTPTFPLENSSICFLLASKYKLIFSFYVSVTWVKFVTCFYENLFTIAFIAWKKKPHP